MPGPISGGHSAAADQNFSVGRQFDLASRQYFSNRSLAQPEGMIHADERSGFGEPVALDHGVSQASPEFFGHAVERGTAGDECPELPSELAMHSPENPPALQEMLAFRRLKASLKFFQSAFVLQIALNFFFQRLQHARHCNQHGHALAPDRANNLGGLQRILKNHRAAQQLRQKHSQKLAEHMAQAATGSESEPDAPSAHTSDIV